MNADLSLLEKIKKHLTKPLRYDIIKARKE
jgi:hypothetical protein